MTSEVGAWVSGSHGNYGWLLYNSSEGTPGSVRGFASRESYRGAPFPRSRSPTSAAWATRLRQQRPVRERRLHQRCLLQRVLLPRVSGVQQLGTDVPGGLRDVLESALEQRYGVSWRGGRL